MCGITGIIGKNNLSKQHFKFFKKQLLKNEVRGNHSTGIAKINGFVSIQKKAVPAKKFVKKLKHGIFTSMLGHTRFATTGAINNDNAHPFMYGDIVGIHNGMIYNYDDHGNYEVDSEVIFDLLNKNKNNFKKTFSKLEGVFAVAWYNVKTEKFYLYRNGNPLFIEIGRASCRERV